MNQLAYQSIGSGSPIIIIHGLFGSKDNWRQIMKKLSDSHQVFTIDLRNHGASFHSASMHYNELAKDIYDFCEVHSIQQPSIIGHSMGGKVAMTFAHNYPNRIDKLIVIDIAPIQYKGTHHEIIEALMAVKDRTFERQSDVRIDLETTIPSKEIIQFLLKNFVRHDHGIQLQINIEAIRDAYSDICAAPPLVHRIAVPTLVIRGTRSNYVHEAGIRALKTHCSLLSLADCPTGHWVHAEAPDRVLQLLDSFLNNDRQ